MSKTQKLSRELIDEIDALMDSMKNSIEKLVEDSEEEEK